MTHSLTALVRSAGTLIIATGVICSPLNAQTAPSPQAPAAPVPAPAAPAGGQPFASQFRVYGTTNYQPNLTAVLPFSLFTLTRREIAARYARAQAFVQCALGDEDPQAVLATGLGSAEERRLLNKMALRNVHCGGPAGGLSVRILRAALGEAMINRVQGPNSSFLIFSDASSARMGVDRSVTPQLTYAFKVAGCHVAAQPDAVRTILSTKPGTRGEQAAERALFSAAPVCAGDTLPKTLNSVVYRAVLASVMSQALAMASAKG